MLKLWNNARNDRNEAKTASWFLECVAVDFCPKKILLLFNKSPIDVAVFNHQRHQALKARVSDPITQRAQQRWRQHVGVVA